MKKYLKPQITELKVLDIITASGAEDVNDVTNGIAQTDLSQTINFSDSILDPIM